MSRPPWPLKESHTNSPEDFPPYNNTQQDYCILFPRSSLAINLLTHHSMQIFTCSLQLRRLTCNEIPPHAPAAQTVTPPASPSFSHLNLNELALFLTKHPISSPSSWSRLKETNPSVLTLPYSFAMSCQKVLTVVLSDVINKSGLYSKSPPLFCLCYILLSLQPSHTCSLLLSCFLIL